MASLTPWTLAEEDLLATLWADLSVENPITAAKALLPARTRGAIMVRASLRGYTTRRREQLQLPEESRTAHTTGARTRTRDDSIRVVPAPLDPGAYESIRRRLNMTALALTDELGVALPDVVAALCSLTEADFARTLTIARAIDGSVRLD